MPTGLCNTMSSYISAQDYRRNSSTTTDTKSNYFPSTNASYCDANDAACTTCLQNTTNMTQFSTFCLGQGGCVCVVICEIAHWQTLAQVQLPFTMASHNETSACASAVSTTAPSSSASASSSTLSSSSSVKKQAFAVEDRCTWYTNQTRCGLPRTCYDCLNVPLENGDVRSYICYRLPHVV